MKRRHTSYRRNRLLDNRRIPTICGHKVTYPITYTCRNINKWLNSNIQLHFIRRPFVKRFALCYRSVVLLSVCPQSVLSCLSVTLVYCDEKVGQFGPKMPPVSVVKRQKTNRKKDKERNEKSYCGRQTGYSPRPPTWSDRNEILHAGDIRGGDRSKFQVSSKSATRFRTYGMSKFALSHCFGHGLLYKHSEKLSETT